MKPVAKTVYYGPATDSDDFYYHPDFIHRISDKKIITIENDGIAPKGHPQSVSYISEYGVTLVWTRFLDESKETAQVTLVGMEDKVGEVEKIIKDDENKYNKHKHR